uniref:WGS project CAEQ00000000 data, annotated contig 659 n=1 Tax=Trypanosoma congolense (strain IL3000) TaxID=1068625 RepID=F9WHJ9_TRYCI|nr:unnamed protein product [Trypanosoma congolense IL3000]
MNFVSLYRSLLKGVHAAKGNPHHLQDTRFILSYPLVEPAFYTTTLGSGVEHPGPLKGIDAQKIVQLCCNDLRRAFESVSFEMVSVTQRFIHMRELAWLKSRLENIVSEATEQILNEARAVASDLPNDDFLSEEVFLRHTHGSSKEVSKAEAAAGSAVKRPKGVASAGALGLRQEMFILQHRTQFPLVREFFNSFAADPQAIANVAMSNAKLQDFVRRNTSRTVTCKNGDVAVTIAVRPFDSSITRKPVGEGSPFSHAYRYFMVRFHVVPHDPSVLSVDVINSYFLRLDVASLELVEDVGYLHASGVWKLAQQVNARRGNMSGSPRNVSGNADDGGGEKSCEVPDEAARPAQPSLQSDPSLQFELSFINASDGPTVMKGQLYYTLTEKDSKLNSEMRVRVISFGNLLLLNDE